MPDSSEPISLMKGIKGLIFRHDDTDYFYMGMRSALCGFLNLHKGGIAMAEYHKCWTANKELADKFGHKIGESGRVTDRE